jgi:hypothetical protein
MTTLSEFYCSPKQDDFQGHTTRCNADLAPSVQAVLAEFQASDVHHEAC